MATREYVESGLSQKHCGIWTEMTGEVLGVPKDVVRGCWNTASHSVKEVRRQGGEEVN